MNDLEDIPDWARAALEQAKHDEIERKFNETLHVLALCQRKLKLHRVTSTWDTRGNVTVAVFGDASGGSQVRYATVAWDSLPIVVHGKIPQPKDED
jgi:hypothetical protein